ncbi:uncharacterized protein AMSG_12325 [Thecamonas trahens ATCC 50062]|uniref:Angiotensin-converting enzyme n=1 Tax=Thecamonas trahens ATCC 50062 TaxID=461836 RepID=A0A0L0DQ29_THETB|nr:hypothetical protein AMSG_12325 [Thecamonas trahens ATCC 50062]KNC54414.1 hypothetical protein AMSG_12325 [Thecamonas trahens ATCC 50062]|eukprot:XP_013753742.1 hypothetical protein AMSG_12325 [Thecamonas trahens ATCC 50062]
MTAPEVAEWVDEVESAYGAAAAAESAAYYAWATDITDDHLATALASSNVTSSIVADAVVRIRSEKLIDIDGLLPQVARKLELLVSRQTIPPGAHAADIAETVADMESFYATKRACIDDACLPLAAADDIIRDPAASWERKAAVWSAWRAGFGALRTPYEELVESSNAGARDLGFADTGAMWRSAFDMDSAEFAAVAERLWTEVQPLYTALHCYVRRELAAAPVYADHAHDPAWAGGALPAHLLGNMWAQDWSHIYSLVEPYPGAGNVELDAGLRATGWDATAMVREGVAFFERLGLAGPGPDFYADSLLVQPSNGRDVVCHASAWDLGGGDVRLKACFKVDGEDFFVVHHELGHIFYYLGYAGQSALFREGANNGFHEAIGDTIVLSLTPAYLRKAGLLPPSPPPPADLASNAAAVNALLKVALERVAFIPFGFVVDKFRWAVFDGSVRPDKWNSHWWALRRKYQGVAPPTSRSADDFDAAAKYHVPANVPYIRYLLAFVLQFQFHDALCTAAGHTGPLHECTIDGSEAAGAALSKMLAAGASQPWQDTLRELTGEPIMSADALLEFFAPLRVFLDDANAAAGATCGWTESPPAPSPPPVPSAGTHPRQNGTTVVIMLIVLLFVAALALAVAGGLWWQRRSAHYHRLSKHTAIVLDDFVAGSNDDDIDAVFGSSSTWESDDGLQLAGVAPRPELALGTFVRVDQRVGRVRYLGRTRFADGFWVGIELVEPCSDLGILMARATEPYDGTCTLEYQACNQDGTGCVAVVIDISTFSPNLHNSWSLSSSGTSVWGLCIIGTAVKRVKCDVPVSGCTMIDIIADGTLLSNLGEVMGITHNNVQYLVLNHDGNCEYLSVDEADSLSGPHSCSADVSDMFNVAADASGLRILTTSSESVIHTLCEFDGSECNTITLFESPSYAYSRPTAVTTPTQLFVGISNADETLLDLAACSLDGSGCVLKAAALPGEVAYLDVFTSDWLVVAYKDVNPATSDGHVAIGICELDLGTCSPIYIRASDGSDIVGQFFAASSVTMAVGTDNELIFVSLPLLPCTSGFRLDASTNACILCSGNTISTGGVCAPCSPGTIASAAATVCDDCSPGTYCPLGTTTPLPCDAGYISATAAANCTACPPGTVSNEGHTVCDSCASAALCPASGLATPYPPVVAMARVSYARAHWFPQSRFADNNKVYRAFVFGGLAFACSTLVLCGLVAIVAWRASPVTRAQLWDRIDLLVSRTDTMPGSRTLRARKTCLGAAMTVLLICATIVAVAIFFVQFQYDNATVTRAQGFGAVPPGHITDDTFHTAIRASLDFVRTDTGSNWCVAPDGSCGSGVTISTSGWNSAMTSTSTCELVGLQTCRVVWECTSGCDMTLSPTTTIDYAGRIYSGVTLKLEAATLGSSYGDPGASGEAGLTVAAPDSHVYYATSASDPATLRIRATTYQHVTYERDAKVTTTGYAFQTQVIARPTSGSLASVPVPAHPSPPVVLEFLVGLQTCRVVWECTSGCDMTLSPTTTIDYAGRIYSGVTLKLEAATLGSSYGDPGASGEAGLTVAAPDSHVYYATSASDPATLRIRATTYQHVTYERDAKVTTTGYAFQTQVIARPTSGSLASVPVPAHPSPPVVLEFVKSSDHELTTVERRMSTLDFVAGLGGLVSVILSVGGVALATVELAVHCGPLHGANSKDLVTTVAYPAAGPNYFSASIAVAALSPTRMALVGFDSAAGLTTLDCATDGSGCSTYVVDDTIVEAPTAIKGWGFNSPADKLATILADKNGILLVVCDASNISACSVTSLGVAPDDFPQTAGGMVADRWFMAYKSGGKCTFLSVDVAAVVDGPHDCAAAVTGDHYSAVVDASRIRIANVVGTHIEVGVCEHDGKSCATATVLAAPSALAASAIATSATALYAAGSTDSVGHLAKCALDGTGCVTAMNAVPGKILDMVVHSSGWLLITFHSMPPPSSDTYASMAACDLDLVSCRVVYTSPDRARNAIGLVVYPGALVQLAFDTTLYANTLVLPPCPLDHKLEPETNACAPCPSHAISTGLICQPCAAGSLPGATPATCAPCPSGSYCPSGATAATPCAAGYVSATGAANCTACPPGTISNADHTTCESCASAALCPASGLAAPYPPEVPLDRTSYLRTHRFPQSRFSDSDKVFEAGKLGLLAFACATVLLCGLVGCVALRASPELKSHIWARLDILVRRNDSEPATGVLHERKSCTGAAMTVLLVCGCSVAVAIFFIQFQYDNATVTRSQGFDPVPSGLVSDTTFRTAIRASLDFVRTDTGSNWCVAPDGSCGSGVTISTSGWNSAMTSTSTCELVGLQTCRVVWECTSGCDMTLSPTTTIDYAGRIYSGVTLKLEAATLGSSYGDPGASGEAGLTVAAPDSHVYYATSASDPATLRIRATTYQHVTYERDAKVTTTGYAFQTQVIARPTSGSLASVPVPAHPSPPVVLQFFKSNFHELTTVERRMSTLDFVAGLATLALALTLILALAPAHAHALFARDLTGLLSPPDAIHVLLAAGIHPDDAAALVEALPVDGASYAQFEATLMAAASHLGLDPIEAAIAAAVTDTPAPPHADHYDHIHPPPTATPSPPPLRSAPPLDQPSPAPSRSLSTRPLAMAAVAVFLLHRGFANALRRQDITHPSALVFFATGALLAALAAHALLGTAMFGVLATALAAAAGYATLHAADFIRLSR